MKRSTQKKPGGGPKKPGKTYQYSSQRTGKEVRRIYVGRTDDPVVSILAEADALMAANQKAADQAADEAIANYGRLEALLQLVAQGANLLMRHARARRLLARPK